MATSSQLLLFAAALACAAAIAMPVAAAEDGPFQPIPNVDAPHIQELGEWAVAQHVKLANDGLRFNKVVGGQFQVVAGLNYIFDIDAVGADGTDSRHTAEVYVQYWTNTRVLVSFDYKSSR